jgi:hypothetical protein
VTAAVARAAARPSVGGAIKLARLLEMSEKEFESRVRQLEADPLFSRLLSAGAVRVQPYTARLASRKPDGRQLSMSSRGLSELLDGRAGLVELIQRIGQGPFEDLFLGDSSLSDAEKASACCISVQEAATLREFVDRAYIQADLQCEPASAPPPKAYCAVAGIELDGKRPMIAFFNREVWKGRYRLDGGRIAELRRSLSFATARRLDQLVCQLELLDRRKSTLFRILETIVGLQTDYLLSGDPANRRPLTQVSIARSLDITQSVLNRLVSNKSVRLPWGLEVPLASLMPSSKRLLLDRVDELVAEHPAYSDRRLGDELARRFGTRLSRRSIAQYRQDLGLGGLQKRLRSAETRIIFPVAVA